MAKRLFTRNYRKPGWGMLFTGFWPHLIFLIFLLNYVMIRQLQLTFYAQSCLTRTQIAADTRCLYIYGANVYEKGSRRSPHKRTACGTDVTTSIPSFHYKNMARYMDPNLIGGVCTSAPNPTATPQPTDTRAPTATRTPAPATPRPTTPPQATATNRPAATNPPTGGPPSATPRPTSTTAPGQPSATRAPTATNTAPPQATATSRPTNTTIPRQPSATRAPTARPTNITSAIKSSTPIRTATPRTAATATTRPLAQGNTQAPVQTTTPLPLAQGGGGPGFGGLVGGGTASPQGGETNEWKPAEIVARAVQSPAWPLISQISGWLVVVSFIAMLISSIIMVIRSKAIGRLAGR